MGTPTSGSNLYGFEAVWLTVNITSLAAATSHWCAAPGDGVIRRIKSVTDGSVSDDTTLGLELSGTDVTTAAGSAALITIAASGSGAGTVDAGEAGLANAVSEGDAVEVTCGGEGSTATPATVFIEFVAAS